MPKRFRHLLPGHDVKTAFEMGWAGLKNGEILKAAATAGFDVFITVDQNLQFQQNLSSLPLGVVILVAPNNRLETLRVFAPEVQATLASMSPRTAVRVMPPTGGNPPAPSP